MMLITLLGIAVAIEQIWSPRLAWLDEESMLILHYNKKNTRAYLVIVKTK